ncbi:NADH-quinone oxidoreductase subunit L [Propylenella binzhouense]|uniref:NADH-quinone oxidoreductase subunit L n=1 Tax=Propylenella binzhouense TaxID=2555902 RepID=A0A964T3L0_9HYPH|nr:NADH-quinone oxidoreductase subunit L [Propylenella binzhouense]MYZ47818.1 NADH-quinone oxidoreductase subunit L [Propylenella binzhouense]
MYSAIVFLPLFGAIIAGLISLAGAAARHPGGSPAHGAEDHATDSFAPRHRGVHAPAHHGAAIAHPHHEPHAESDAAHGGHGPGAAEIVTSAFLVICAVLSWIAFFRVGANTGEAFTVPVLRWIESGALAAGWALRVDTLTAVMLVVVTTVSALVHVYSIGYMSHDPHRPRFFAYLSLFTFAMLMLVTADNLVQMFFGWEGVGLASYLLIGFWYHRPSANAAAMKAFIVNRVGDFGFALGVFGVFVLFGSVEFSSIFANTQAVAEGGEVGLRIFGSVFTGEGALTVVCLLLFMGAMGKSAQVPLHTWLPDAMEGPTPVSALIHAATMVTAGVFMVARLSPLFEHAPDALIVVTVVGAITAFFAATVGLVQNDIKRVIAYSTCSQLGYMFVALGLGAYSVAIFHLFTHAFFKALLFLGAGSVIHAVSDEQDMRRMGGLRRVIPVTYAMMLVGTLALTGFPFTAGYYSKDAIIEAAYAGHTTAAGLAFVLTVVAAAFTSFYSWRLVFMTFHGKPRASAEVMEHAHESASVMLIPLYVLAAGALLAGIAFSGLFIGEAQEGFWKGALFFGPENEILEEMHHAPFWVGISPFVAMVLGFLVALWFYILSPDTPRRIGEQHEGLYRFLLNKWYFDELYDFLFVRPVMALGRFLWKRGDGWLIDGFGPDGVSARVLDVTRNVVKLQTGYVYHYAFAMLIGVAILVTWMMFAG